MQAEIKALHDNNTWKLVELPSGRKPIRCRCVIRIKENSDGSINKYKANFHQQPGLDFSETFSSVVKPVTIRIVLSLAVSFQWPLRQLDINNAFLNGMLEEDIYMSQPPGFIEPGNKHLVCKLQKSLYGLKQAPCAWFDRLTSVLLMLGFSKSKCNPSLFIFSTPTATVYMLVYVDDIILTGNFPSLLQKLVNQLNEIFSLRGLGTLDYFLGIEVKALKGSYCFLKTSTSLTFLPR
uniref:Retrovirus-related Pol polyprotein from transposon TNT 1-94 n=1 Tax=Cajanus cajan TaxID=3821 RepID=A0A151R396_CAJCA|nr:Retrovirus-related Pol polyprotein from transposon TNT 1-94 [Cajanus cajan]